MRLLTIDELRDLNKQFLNDYNEFEKPKLQKIASLKFLTDYDAYLIVCSLCNVRSDKLLELKSDLLYTRSTLHSQIDFSQNHEHSADDYENINFITCKNLNRTNKYGLYEYEINNISRVLVNNLWSYKAKDCLKYVSVEENRIVVSISKAQIYGFITALDALDISYDINDILEGLVYNNNSNNTLVDYTKYTLPFEPYSFQIDDARNLVTKKRALIGHEMGCFIGDTQVHLENDEWINISSLTNKGIFKILSYDILSQQFVLANAIAKLTRKNAKLVIVKYCSNNIIYETYCTPDHKFLTENNQWIEANNLKPDTKLVSIKDAYIIDVLETNRQEDVYCLIVDTTHNFLIQGDIVVHNCGKTFIATLVGQSINTTQNVNYRSIDNLDYNTLIVTDKGPLPIGQIVEENIDCKVQVIQDGIAKFVNILDRRCIDV